MIAPVNDLQESNIFYLFAPSLWLIDIEDSLCTAVILGLTVLPPFVQGAVTSRRARGTLDLQLKRLRACLFL